MTLRCDDGIASPLTSDPSQFASFARKRHRLKGQLEPRKSELSGDALTATANPQDHPGQGNGTSSEMCFVMNSPRRLAIITKTSVRD
jgi:hypothetical protein